MKKLLVNRPFLSLLLLGTMVVAMGALFGNPYMSWYHNITVYTNTYVAGTNFAKTLTVTNDATVGSLAAQTNVTAGSGITLNGPLKRAIITSSEPARFIGTGATGASSQSFITFYDSNGTTRRGYLGDALNSDTDIYLQAETGNLWLYDATGSLKINGGNGVFSGDHLTLGTGTVNTNTPYSKLLHDAANAAAARADLQLAGTNSLTLSNLTANGQSGFAGFTTANLPTGVAVGYQTYCTDCLTPWGVGDRVEWDGAAWRTMRARIGATTNYNQYILNCVGSVFGLTTPITIAYFSPENFATTGSGGLPRASSVSGAGATASLNGSPSSTYGDYQSLFTGTTTNGFSSMRGILCKTLAAGDLYSCGGNYTIGFAPDANEIYWSIVGFDSQLLGAIPVTGAYFLYDMFNVTAHGQTGAITNHWICVTARASAYTFADSGITPSTSVVTPDRLMVQLTTTNAAFYVNGTLVQSLATAATIPNTALYANRAVITKSGGAVGTTTRGLHETAPWIHLRLATARVFP